MPRYRLTIAYDGTDFHGWQRQEAPDVPGGAGGDTAREGLRTVQDVLERAVRFVVREPITILGASRTDAGVHARAQTAAFTCSDERTGPPDERLSDAINSRLPEDALVVDARRTREDFDPISDCVAKGYRYLIHAHRRRPLWDRRFVHHVAHDLDAEAMAGAAGAFVGEHDFAAFAKAGHGRQTTVRTVHGCGVARVNEEVIAIDVSGAGFLHNMVRIMAGTLVEVGRGRLTRADIEGALATGDRRRAGPTLPPTGLCLEWIRYREDAPDGGPVAGARPLASARRAREDR